MTIHEGITLTNNGIIKKDGEIINNGTINGTGMFSPMFLSLRADGSLTSVTTTLTLTFDKDIDNISAADINIMPALTKGLFKRTGYGVYTLEVSGIDINMEIAVTVTGNNISRANKRVIVYPQPGIIGNTSVKLYMDNNTTPLTEGGSTALTAAETGTYTVSIDAGSYSEIIWYLNGTKMPQWSSNTSVVLTKRIPGIYFITVEATRAGEKNIGNHYFVVGQ